MIKATARGNGRTLVLLGITDQNIARLREGRPIHIHGEEMGIGPLDICIITGKDEADLVKTLKPMIGDETAMRDLRSEKRQ